MKLKKRKKVKWKMWAHIFYHNNEPAAIGMVAFEKKHLLKSQHGKHVRVLVKEI